VTSNTNFVFSFDLPPVCGPDITDALKKTVDKIRREFNSWSDTKKDLVCASMDAGGFGVAWDIQGLHGGTGITDWINKDPNQCPTQSDCHDTVAVDGQCYYSGTVNYLSFGVMNKLCEISQSWQVVELWLWKQVLPAVRGKPAARNAGIALDMSYAGYKGWPDAGVTLPSGDRPRCGCWCPRDLSAYKEQYNPSPADTLKVTFGGPTF
jgi:hypothetical protein